MIFCTFKRGKDFITAQIIDECGLKGKKIGGAVVSEKHAGFIINDGNASTTDILKFSKTLIFSHFLFDFFFFTFF